MESIYFETQTGVIREQHSSRSNFYQYRLSPADRPVIEAAASKATPGCGGLEYEEGFLNSLEGLERSHQRALVREARRF